MKILVIVDGFYPDESGGITNSLRLTIRGLVMRKHEVTVLTKRLNAWAPAYQRLDGYDLYRYLSPRRESAFYRAYPLFYFVTLPRAVRRLCRQSTYDLAYIHNPFQVVAFSRTRMKLPIVYACHAPMTEIEVDAQGGKYGRLTPFLGPIERVARALQERSLAEATVTLTFSEYVRREMEALQGNTGRGARFETVPLPVDTERFAFAQDSAPAREALGLSLGRPLLLTVRRLVARMGLENLIAAVGLVREKRADVLLLIGGRGYLEHKLRQRVKANALDDHVRILGFVPPEQLPLYYQAADLFVLPSVALEGFGVATVEALSCGTPVLGTPVGAMPEILGPLGGEFLSDGTSAEQLARGIMRWLDEGTRRNIRHACREYCVYRFGLDSVVPQLEKVLRAAAVTGGSCA